MSSISGVGSSSAVQESRPAPRAQASAVDSDGDGDRGLQVLQKLAQQIEGTANTRAIPAHQSW